jgi:hypothetical protein
MRVFDATAAFTEEDRNLVGPSGAERVSVLSSTRGLLEMLGAPPIMGRTFTEHDWDAAHNDVAMLSYSLFASRFSARPGNLGWTIRKATGFTRWWES